MPTVFTNYFPIPITCHNYYYLDFFARSRLSHCYGDCNKIFKLSDVIQVQELLHQPLYMLNKIHIRTAHLPIILFDSLALQVSQYYLSVMISCTTPHELMLVPPEDLEDVCWNMFKYKSPVCF